MTESNEKKHRTKNRIIGNLRKMKKTQKIQLAIAVLVTLATIVIVPVYAVVL